MDYNTLLRINRLSWVLEENDKVAVQHIISEIRPVKPKSRLESDIAFAHHELKKYFKEFFKHAKKFSDAFVLVDSGSLNEDTQVTRPADNKGNGQRNASLGNKSVGAKGNSTTTKPEPVCLWENHAAKEIRHRLKDCRACPEDVKKEVFEKLARDKAKYVPFKSTRSQTYSKQYEDKIVNSSIGVLWKDRSSSPSCSVRVSDGDKFLKRSARYDDGSNESIASPKIAEDSVLKGVGRIT